MFCVKIAILSAPTKWQINVDTEIGAGKFLMIGADGLNTITVYPNPAAEKLAVSAQKKANAMIEMFSPTGQMVRQIKLDCDGIATIDDSHQRIG